MNVTTQPKKTLTCIIATLCLTLAASAPWAHTAEDNSLPSLAPMLKAVNPAVVNISIFTTRPIRNNPLLNDPRFRQFFNLPEGDLQQQLPKRRQQSSGSGVIINAKKGIVITNHHVVNQADQIQVSLIDGRVFEAELLGSDPELDVAVLKIETSDLTEVEFADSDNLDIGDYVVAIGNPFGLGQTVTTGIVSALGRSGLGIEGYENFIQTDASINPGNSGGALVNLAGKLVGINTAIISTAGANIGIGFAIPTNMAKVSIDQIIETGSVKRGQIGVRIQDIEPALRSALKLKNGQSGVLIVDVSKKSTAQEAGLEAGDIVLSVDGKTTGSTGQLRSRISVKQIDDTVTLKILRLGKEIELDVKVGKRTPIES